LKVTIDRFEGNYAVCEANDKSMLTIEKSKLPRSAREGDILIISGDKITIDVKGTREKKKNIKKLVDDLWE
jgi:hypothetical protein